MSLSRSASAVSGTMGQTKVKLIRNITDHTSVNFVTFKQEHLEMNVIFLFLFVK